MPADCISPYFPLLSAEVIYSGNVLRGVVDVAAI
jgi:hypothetical protein